MARDDVEQLNEIKENDARLAETVELYSDLIRARSAADVHPVVVAPYDATAIRDRFSQGVPLIRAEEIALDWSTFGGLFQEVCKIAAHHRPDLAAEFAALLTRLLDNPEEIRAHTAVFMNEGSITRFDSVDAEMLDSGEQVDLLNFVLTHTVHPFLRTHADALKSILEEQLGSDWEKYWQRGRCPICGGEPDFAFLAADSGNRHLVCSRCDSTWLFARIKCAFCGTTEPSQLSYFPTADDAYRVYVCYHCGRYLKAVDRRRSSGPVSFAVERVNAIELDLEAREQGYR